MTPIEPKGSRGHIFVVGDATKHYEPAQSEPKGEQARAHVDLWRVALEQIAAGTTRPSPAALAEYALRGAHGMRIEGDPAPPEQRGEGAARVDLEEKLRGTEAACRDYEHWLDKALAALGVKTVFDIPNGPASPSPDEQGRVERLEHLLQHEIKVREDIARSQQDALRREREAKQVLAALLTVIVGQNGEDGGEVVGLSAAIEAAKHILRSSVPTTDEDPSSSGITPEPAGAQGRDSDPAPSVDPEARVRELERALEVLLRFFSPSGPHDTTCPLNVMHDDFYENPDEDEHPVYPRVCECHVEPVARARAALSSNASQEGE